MSKLSVNKIKNITTLARRCREPPSLNYPHISHLDNIGSHDCTYYLVVDGRTLGGKYAMPPNEILELG